MTMAEDSDLSSLSSLSDDSENDYEESSMDSDDDSSDEQQQQQEENKDNRRLEHSGDAVAAAAMPKSQNLIKRTKFKFKHKPIKLEKKVKRKTEKKGNNNKLAEIKSYKRPLKITPKEGDGASGKQNVEEQLNEHYVKLPNGRKIVIPLDSDHQLNKEFFTRVVRNLCTRYAKPGFPNIRVRADLSLLLRNRLTGQLRIGPQVTILLDTDVCLGEPKHLKSLLFRLNQVDLGEKVYEHDLHDMYDINSKYLQVERILAFSWIFHYL